VSQLFISFQVEVFRAGMHNVCKGRSERLTPACFSNLPGSRNNPPFVFRHDLKNKVVCAVQHRDKRMDRHRFGLTWKTHWNEL